MTHDAYESRQTAKKLEQARKDNISNEPPFPRQALTHLWANPTFFWLDPSRLTLPLEWTPPPNQTHPLCARPPSQAGPTLPVWTPPNMT